MANQERHWKDLVSNTRCPYCMIAARIVVKTLRSLKMQIVACPPN